MAKRRYFKTYQDESTCEFSDNNYDPKDLVKDIFVEDEFERQECYDIDIDNNSGNNTNEDDDNNSQKLVRKNAN
ncbi:1835_t:CDS:2 [Entrophospora sp. SA101]|nr:6365_t:CDS:2 [Entrophospora sp. SA101]CAJ0884704.1 1835_t:CDS:2 [Entrophospora sp. SA101]